MYVKEYFKSSKQLTACSIPDNMNTGGSLGGGGGCSSISSTGRGGVIFLDFMVGNAEINNILKRGKAALLNIQGRLKLVCKAQSGSIVQFKGIYSSPCTFLNLGINIF